MLFILLKNNCNISPERKTILLLCEIIRNGGSVELSKQRTAVSKQGILRFVCPKNSPDFNEIPLKNNMTFSYDGKIYTVNEITEKVTNQNNLVSKKRLGENPVFRTRRAGDRFTYPDRMVTKPLRKVFNEQKIPSEMRTGCYCLRYPTPFCGVKSLVFHCRERQMTPKKPKNYS